MRACEGSAAPSISPSRPVQPDRDAPKLGPLSCSYRRASKPVLLGHAPDHLNSVKQGFDAGVDALAAWMCPRFSTGPLVDAIPGQLNYRS